MPNILNGHIPNHGISVPVASNDRIHSFKQKVDVLLSNKDTTFHVTNTGAQFEQLFSFISDGADINISDGSGQGKGFYVFTDLSHVISHIDFRKKNWPDNCIYGYDLVVNINEEINSCNFDLDFEHHAKIFIDFLLNNLDLFRSSDADTIKISETQNIDINKIEYLEGIKEKGIDSVLVINVTNLPGNYINSRSINTSGTDIDVFEAMIFGKVFEELKKCFPELVKAFEEDIFSKIKNQKLNFALKYNNHKKPDISSVAIFIDGKKIVINKDSFMQILKFKGREDELSGYLMELP